MITWQHIPIHLRWQLGGRSEFLLVAVYRVCEPYRAIAVYSHIVYRIELTAVETVKQSLASVWSFTLHKNQARGLEIGALAAK